MYYEYEITIKYHDGTYDTKYVLPCNLEPVLKELSFEVHITSDGCHMRPVDIQTIMVKGIKYE